LAALADPLTVRPRAGAVGVAGAGGWVGVSLGAAWAAEQRGAMGRRVALTLDDGTATSLAAWPLLRARRGATLGVVTGRVGQPADWDGPRGTPLLAWPQLRALAAEGVEIAAHGHAHNALDTLSPAEAVADLQLARATMRAQLGDAAGAGLAYPYGRASAALAQAAASTGYAWAATARGGRNTTAMPPHRLRRTLMHGRDGSLRFALKLWLGYAAAVEWRMDVRRVA
jgi:peptidoglycan/xylan/chitin deacetylase (PgdA/CDA1 family)